MQQQMQVSKAHAGYDWKENLKSIPPGHTPSVALRQLAKGCTCRQESILGWAGDFLFAGTTKRTCSLLTEMPRQLGLIRALAMLARCFLMWQDAFSCGP
jgi:hypothetical protein